MCERQCEIQRPRQTNQSEQLRSKFFELQSALPIFLISAEEYKKTLENGLKKHLGHKMAQRSSNSSSSNN